MAKINVKKLLAKEPYRFAAPSGPYDNTPVGASSPAADYGCNLYFTRTSDDFLREYHVTGHRINDPAWYPDLWTFDKDANEGKGQWVCEKSARCAFPFQYVITVQQLIHLCGNRIVFEDANQSFGSEHEEDLIRFKQGWLKKNMETAFYECAFSEKTTGDCALAFYLDGGRMGWRVFSEYNPGERIYPSFDRVTGRLNAFARRTSSVGEDGQAREYVEVWDKTHVYVFSRGGKTAVGKAASAIAEAFGLDGWMQDGPAVRHGFNRVPVAYKRNRIGACWSMAQPSIDNYELAVSQLCENNKSYAFPIMFLAGNDAEVKGRADGRPFAIVSSDAQAKASLLSGGGGSDSFNVQLTTLLKNIFMGGFAVVPPEVRSGDLPGVAIKLIYSPSLEKAMADAKEWDSFIDDMTDLFKYGYGIEIGKAAAFAAMDISGRIEPYVHENTAEKITLLCNQVTSGILSSKTASQKTPDAVNNEYARILEQTRMEVLGLGQEEVKDGSVE